MAADSPRILVVDDDPDTRDVLELALALEGYSVDLAPDCNCALGKLQLNSPSVILLDYRLKGQPPYEFLSGLRERKVDAPVILLSAEKECAVRAMELGVEYHLSKPFELDVLLELIRVVDPAHTG